MVYLNEIRFIDGSVKEYALCAEDDNALYSDDRFIAAWRINIMERDWQFINQYGCDINVNHIISNQTVRIIGNTEYYNKKAEHLNQYK